MDNAIITLQDYYRKRVKNNLSRNEKRKADRELKHFIEEVEPYIDQFEEHLFDEESILPYKTLYNTFLERIVYLCRFLNDNKYKIIKVDTYFFQKTYKPLEIA